MSTTNNLTYLQNKLSLSVKLVLVVPSLLCLCGFLCIIAVILKVYFSISSIRETARYILFVHMLINDTLYLVVGFILLLALLSSVTMFLPLCYFLVSLGSTTFRVTLDILAVMAMERYVSVCLPFRHAKLCTSRRTNMAVIIIWGMELVSKVVYALGVNLSVETDFNRYTPCNWYLLQVSQLQVSVMYASVLLNLVMAGLVILFSYIKIVLVASRIASDKSSAFKAAKTVTIHAFQLIPCIASQALPLVEQNLEEWKLAAQFINFIIVMCLPRFLGPLVYGLRDEVLRRYIRKHLGMGQLT